MSRSKKPPSPQSEKRTPPSKQARRWALPAAVAIAASLLPLLALLRGDATPLLQATNVSQPLRPLLSDGPDARSALPDGENSVDRGWALGEGAALEERQRQVCRQWAAAGECERNPAVMRQCAEECGGSGGGVAEPTAAAAAVAAVADGDEDAHCGVWAAAGECEANPNFMLRKCRASCADRQPALPAADSWTSAEECAQWAGSGECESNSAFMLTSCARSCAKVANAQDAYRARCPRPEGSQPALVPGAMNSTFERVLREFAHLGPELVSTDPPVLLFHSFLSAEEADAFIAHGKGKYTESRGVGVDSEGRMTDVKTEIRTSSHTWCQEAECLDDPLVQRVTARVSDVTRTPEANGEFAQLVYYNSCPEPSHPSCAFYRRHSDFIAGDVHRNQGVRIYTVFMYLNDVEEGGGTRFTDLPSGQITTEARRGKAIFWPSVLADAPYTVDPRTHHEALPVTRGEKYGANIWIHQFDFRTPYAKGCTMN